MGAKLDGPFWGVNHSALPTLDTAPLSPHSQKPVNRTQFIALNLIGGACALLILCDLGLGILNSRANQSVGATQAQFNQAQQLQNTAQNLIMRVARAAQSESALHALMEKHDFKVNVNTNAPTNATP